MSRIKPVKVSESVFSVTVKTKEGNTDTLTWTASNAFKIQQKCINLNLNLLSCQKISDVTYYITN